MLTVVLCMLGVDRLVAGSAWRRRKLMVLCYHGIALRDEHEWDPELFVTPQFFRRRLEILRTHGYTVLPLGEALRRLRQGNLPMRSVAITFDDGLYNFFSKATPLLEEFGVPGTIYVSSYHCVNRRPLLVHTIRYLLWRASKKGLQSADILRDSRNYDLGNATEREAMAQVLAHDARKYCVAHGEQLQWLAALAQKAHVDWQDFLDSRILQFMTEEDIRNASRRGMDIQLHTHRHRTPRDEVAFTREIVENKDIVERLTGKPATHFCYPSGDYDPMFYPILRKFGIESATTCDIGLASARDDALLIPRYIDTMAQSESQFRSWISGMALALSGRL